MAGAQVKRLGATTRARCARDGFLAPTLAWTSPAVTYELLPRLLHCLSRDMTADDLAAAMEVNKPQMNAWLKRAVEDGDVEKLARPVRYRRRGPRLALG